MVLQFDNTLIQMHSSKSLTMNENLAVMKYRRSGVCSGGLVDVYDPPHLHLLNYGELCDERFVELLDPTHLHPLYGVLHDLGSVRLAETLHVWSRSCL